MTDAKNRTPNVTMETVPVVCGRCKRQLTPLVIEELAGFLQLRAGEILISNIAYHIVWNIGQNLFQLKMGSIGYIFNHWDFCYLVRTFHNSRKKICPSYTQNYKPYYCYQD